MSFFSTSLDFSVYTKYYTLSGKIDIILTKSISRFGRNTIELLETIRELKKLNNEVL